MKDMRSRIILCLAAVFCLGLVSGCGAKRPVLYPNAKFKQVGEAQAKADVDACMEMAGTHGVKDTSGDRVAKNAAVGAAVGAAAGAAAAAVWGGNVGRSAGAGAAGSAAAAAVYGMFGSGGPDPVFRNFVDQCLREKGYQLVGWQ